MITGKTFNIDFNSTPQTFSFGPFPSGTLITDLFIALENSTPYDFDVFLAGMQVLSACHFEWNNNNPFTIPIWQKLPRAGTVDVVGTAGGNNAKFTAVLSYRDAPVSSGSKIPTSN